MRSRRLGTDSLGRPRLSKRLDADQLPRLTVISAGAGSGKTTLLTQCYDSRYVVWQTITPADRSLTVLARNVVRKLRLTLPQISAELVTAVEGASGPGEQAASGRPAAIAASLARELDVILERDLVLVFDDLHELERGSDSVNFLAALSRHAPERLKVVIASREELPFQISRLDVAGEVDMLLSDDLAFTREEVEELVTLRLGDTPAGMAEEITSLTGGWPAATVLAIEAASLGSESLGTDLVEKSSLFDYLAEEVLSTETAASLASLRSIAVLPWATVELLEFLGRDWEPSAARSVYVGRVPDVPGAVVVSPLVREFLHQHHPMEPEELTQLLVRAADWYQDQGWLSESLECLLDAGRPEDLARYLGSHGEAMVASGLNRQVADAMSELATEMKTPELLLIEAEVNQLLGDWESALGLYRVLAPGDGPIPPAVAWRYGFLHHMRGNVEEALSTYRRGELDTSDVRSTSALLGWQASAHWLRGERDEAKMLADRALELARSEDDAKSLATAHTVLALVAALDGDRAANDVHYLKALEHSERARDIVQSIRIRTNRASHFLEEGQFDTALSEAEIALRMAEMTGFELWRAMTLSNRALVHFHLGRLEEATADLYEARAAFRGIGSRLEAYPLAHLGLVHRTRGDTARSMSAYEEAIALAETQNDLQALVPALSGLARLLAPTDPKTASKLAKRATEVDSVIGRVEAVVAAGWAALHSGRHEEAVDLAEDAVRIARERRDRPGLGEALELRAAARPENAQDDLLQAKAVWEELKAPIALARTDVAIARLLGGVEGSVMTRRAAETLRKHGATGLASAARSEPAIPAPGDEHPVTIKSLGGFEVLVDGRHVPRAAWQSRVARQVLWMLIAARGRPVNREVIIDRLWPDDDLSKASNRLSVALSTVRKVLNPSGEVKTDHHITHDRDSVMLNLDRINVDVEDFMNEAKIGLRLFHRGEKDKGLAYLSSAEDRYVGEFLEEEPYAEWAVALREEARSDYVNIAAVLAEVSESKGDFDAAARRYLRTLERDMYNEPAHLGLISAMARSGRHGTARRLYGLYVSRMAELDIEPEPFPALSSRAE